MTHVNIPAGTIVRLGGEASSLLKGELEVRHKISAQMFLEEPTLKIVAVKSHLYGVNLVVENCRVENGVIIQTHES